MKTLALVVNDAERIHCALNASGVDLKGDRHTLKGVTGVAYYSNGEVLIAKRPVMAGVDAPILPAKAVTNTLVVSIEDATLGKFRVEDVQPYRFRQYVGVVGGFLEGTRGLKENIMDNLPRYIARNIQGESWKELIFHLFLSYLHDISRIDDPNLSTGVLLESTGSMLRILPKFLSKRMLGSNENVHMIISNGRTIMGFSTVDNTILLRRMRGIKQCPLCSNPETGPVDHPNVVAATMLIASGEGRIPGFSPLKSYEVGIIHPDGTAVVKDILRAVR